MLTVVVLVLILLGYLCLVGLFAKSKDKRKSDEFGAGYVAGAMYNDDNNDRFF